MSNTVAESGQDEDLGSAGVMLFSDLKTADGQAVQLETGAGKDGKLDVFNRANMGKFSAQNGSTIYQELTGAVFSISALFNGTVYCGAVGERIRAFAVDAGLLSAQPTSMTDAFFEYPGSTPAISANGATDPILWAVENANPAVLHAYDASNLADELYNSNQASSGHDPFGAGKQIHHLHDR